MTHVRRHHAHYHRRGTGHLYQGRFKSFPVSEDEYFLTFCRYVEANAMRARLVESAQQWRWCGPWRRRPPQQGLRLEPLTRGSAPELDDLERRRPVGGRTAGGAGLRETGPPLGTIALDAGDRRPVETGLHTPRTRSAQKDARQLVMSLFLYSGSFNLPKQSRMYSSPTHRRGSCPGLLMEHAEQLLLVAALS